MQQFDLFGAFAPSRPAPQAVVARPLAAEPVKETSPIQAPEGVESDLSVSPAEIAYCVQLLGDVRPVIRCSFCSKPVMCISYHMDTCPEYRRTTAIAETPASHFRCKTCKRQAPREMWQTHKGLLECGGCLYQRGILDQLEAIVAPLQIEAREEQASRIQEMMSEAESKYLAERAVEFDAEIDASLEIATEAPGESVIAPIEVETIALATSVEAEVLPEVMPAMLDKALPAREQYDRDLLYYRWMKDGPGKSMIPREPTDDERRLAIPEIASRLWYYVKGAAMVHAACDEEVDPAEDWLYTRYEGLGRRYIKLLVYCGLEEAIVRSWAREAWKRVKEGYAPWFEWPSEASKLLAKLGYTLLPGEFIGWEAPKRF